MLNSVGILARKKKKVTFMESNKKTPGLLLLKLWSRLNGWPGGRWLFHRVLFWNVPYTGSIHGQVEVLQPGYCRVSLRERRRLQNHLRSIHAIALANLGEMTSGLAMLTGLPSNVRGIVVHLAIDYFKKARGNLVAESHCRLPQVDGEVTWEVITEIQDQVGDTVARTTTRWQLDNLA